MEKVTKRWILVGITAGTLLIAGMIFRFGFVRFVDSHELGYSYNKFSGEIDVLPRTGFFLINPFKVAIHTVDLRPMQVRIEANNRVLNAKLIRFRPEGLIQFIELHGRGSYQQSSGPGSPGLAEILKSYAYEDMGLSSEEELEKKYKFLDILSGTNNVSQVQMLNESSLSDLDSLKNSTE